jgi:hypothetical protein
MDEIRRGEIDRPIERYVRVRRHALDIAAEKIRSFPPRPSRVSAFSVPKILSQLFVAICFSFGFRSNPAPARRLPPDGEPRGVPT